MKKYFLLFLSLLSLCTASVTAASNPAALPNNALLPMPSEKELQEIQQFLDTLDPKELEELTKIGEEIIQQAEKEGRPLFAPAPKAKAKPLAKPVKKPVRTVKKVKKPVKVVDTKDTQSLQKVIAQLTESIASIRQKAVSDEGLTQTLTPHSKNLNNLVYYLSVMGYSKHLAHLTEKEFIPLKKEIESLSKKVKNIDDELIVPEITVLSKQTKAKKKKYAEQLQNADMLIKKFIQLITTSITQQKTLINLERVLKKYEPEALKIKQDQEAKELKAKEQVQKLPTTNTGRISSGSRYGGRSQGGRYQPYNPRSSGGGYSRYNDSPYGGGHSPSIGGAAKSGGPGGSTSPKNSSKPSADKNKKKDDKKDTSRKETEIEKFERTGQEIQEKISKIAHEVSQQRPNIDLFLDNYIGEAGAVTDGISKSATELFENASYSLNKIKKDLTAWVKQAGKKHQECTRV